MQASKVDWRPFEEYPCGQRIPEGCFFVHRKHGIITTRDSFDNNSGDDSFAIIEKPVVERKLKACPHCRHGLSSGLKIKEEDGCSQVWCLNCGAKGPIAHDEPEAKELWGYE